MKFERIEFNDEAFARLCRDVGASFAKRRGFDVSRERGTFPNVYVRSEDAYLVRIPKAVLTHDDTEFYVLAVDGHGYDVVSQGLFSNAVKIRSTHPEEAIPRDRVESNLRAAFARHGQFCGNDSTWMGLDISWESQFREVDGGV